MHAQDVGSLHEGHRIQHSCAVQGMFGIGFKRHVDHAFARHTHQQRGIQCMKCVETSHQLVVLLHRLGEAKPRISDDIGNSHLPQFIDAASHPFQHVRGDIVVIRQLRHSLRSAPHVHEHVGNLQAGYGREHRLIERATRDVIDDVSAPLFHAASCHIGTIGVHRQDHVGSYTSDGGQRPFQTFHLFRRINRFTARAR